MWHWRGAVPRRAARASATGTVGLVSDVYEPDRVITCIDCGGRAHLTSYAPEMGWAPGDVTVYRCEDCLDAWYLEVPDYDVWE